MKAYWVVLIINGIVEAHTPLGIVTLSKCEEFAARQLMLVPTNMMTRVTYKCITR